MKSLFKVTTSIIGLLLIIAISIAVLPSLHTKYLYYKVSREVVRIVNPSEHRSGGTGFQIKAPSGNKYVLTNRHICLGARQDNFVDANFPDDSTRFYKLAIKEISVDTDICLVEALPERSGVSLASSIDIGEEIGIVGHPSLQSTTLSRGLTTNYETVILNGGIGLTDTQCVEQGGVNKKEEIKTFLFTLPITICIIEVRSIRTSALAYPGNSGSPVVNIFGNVVGVTFAVDSEMHYAYIVPLKDIILFLQDR